MQGIVYRSRRLIGCPTPGPVSTHSSTYSEQADFFTKQMAVILLGILWQKEIIRGGNKDSFPV